MTDDFVERQHPRGIAEMRQLLSKRDPTEAERLDRLRILWATTFKIPPNDERLLQLRESEVVEQLAGQLAVDEERAARLQEARRGDPDGPAQVEENTGEEAANLADKPYLTGDPEWDAMEIEATSPDNAALIR